MTNSLLRMHLRGALACLTTLALVIVAGARPLAAQEAAVAAPADAPFRMAMSARLLTDINENDAKAAVKAWGQTLGKQSGVLVATSPCILSGADALVRAFSNHELDAATTTTDEYLMLAAQFPTTNLLCEGGAEGGHEYLLLVRKDSPIKRLEDLKGRRLLALDDPKMCLAIQWLDVLLIQGGFSKAADFFSGITSRKKLSAVVLPVFFHSADVCLVVRRGFETMVELNPQVGAQLVVLTASPRFITGLAFFRANCPEPQMSKVKNAIRSFYENPRGQQIMVVFQSGPVNDLPDRALDTARQLVAEHERLCPSSSEPIRPAQAATHPPP